MQDKSNLHLAKTLHVSNSQRLMLTRYLKKLSHLPEDRFSFMVFLKSTLNVYLPHIDRIRDKHLFYIA